jgi:hypothetical protein
MEYRRPGTRSSTDPRVGVGDKFFIALCFALLGYALGGRGFAYLFFGEMLLCIGIGVLVYIGVVGRLMSIRALIPLVLFMCWGAACTIPYFDKYGKDTIRDAVVWGYGTYAFIVAGLLISEPTRVQRMVIYYRKFVIIFLLLAPIVTILTGFFDLPAMPGTNVPIIQVKGGDICVHLAGTFAYIVALGRGMNPWFTSLMYPLNLGLNVQGRAGMVAFAVAVAVAMTLRPFHPRMMRIFFVTAVGLFFFWASEIKIEKGPRELSFDFLEKALMSIVKESDDTAMEGSKEWRMNWWKDIVNYTFHGKYFWMGKGFGINLANDDGYQVDSEDALRSPHNGHMTMLARTGVPGLGIWAAVQLTWGVIIVKSYIRARRDKRMNWSGVFMFLGSYWAAFLANATFDVFLEGPMGGIWFWCIYGAGIGCAYLYKRYPDLLTPPEVEPVGASPVTTPPRR